LIEPGVDFVRESPDGAAELVEVFVNGEAFGLLPAADGTLTAAQVSGNLLPGIET
jgi:hypothetical protein